MSDPVTPPSPSFMNRIVRSSLGQPLLVLLLTLLLIGAGTRSLDRLPVDAYPDLAPVQVDIVTQWPGHAAEEVERLITVPVEVGMNGIPQSVKVRSISLYGLSDVTYTFAEGTDKYFARQEVFNRMGDISLPDGVTPSVSPLSSPSGLIYRYVLQSSDRSPTDLKTFEDWIIEPAFKFPRSRPPWGRTIPTPAAASIRRVASSITSAARAGWRRWKISAMSYWRCTMARRRC